MKGVLVTGATTPLGLQIVEQIEARGEFERVVAIGIEPEDRAPALLREGISRYFRVDLTRGRNVRELMFGRAFEHGVQAIVHTAHHRKARVQGRGARKLHVTGTRNLLRLAEQHPGIRKFVYRGSGVVYRIESSTPNLLREDRELDLSRAAPQYVRDWVEADLAVCARLATPDLKVSVLRCAEILAPESGSQLHDYLGSRVCFRPMGFDPLVNVLTVEDTARALVAALHADKGGVYNIPGADTLPLSLAIQKWGRVDAPVPGPLMGPLYRWRARVRGTDFRWKLNKRRFHSGAILDGSRAHSLLGYEPSHRVDWPRPDAGPPSI